MSPLLLLLLLSWTTILQDVAERLLEELGDDSVEIRDRAAEKLIRLGERARAALRRAAASDNADKKARASELLKTLDLFAELRPWYALESRVTLSGEMTLEQAAQEIGRQSGQSVPASSWPEGRFRIDLREAGFWHALEAIGEADGKRMLSMTNEGPKFTGDAWRKPRSVVAGPFRIATGGSSLRREFDVNSKAGETTTTQWVLLSWERSIDPVRSFLSLQAVRDNAGNDWTEGFAEYQQRIFSGYAPRFLEEKRSYIQGFASRTARPAPPGAEALALEGTVTVYVRGAAGDIELSIPASGTRSESVLDVFDDKLSERFPARILLADFGRKETTATCSLSIQKIDPRLVEDLFNHLYLHDREGRKYQGTPKSISKPSDGRTFSLEFKGVPQASELMGMVIRLPRRLVKKLIPFSFRDVPLP